MVLCTSAHVYAMYVQCDEALMSHVYMLIQLSIAGPILKKTNVFASKEKQSPREIPIPVTSGPPQKNKNRFTPSLLPISKLQEEQD